MSGRQDPVQRRLYPAGDDLYRGVPDRNASVQWRVFRERRRNRVRSIVPRVPGSAGGLTGHLRRHHVRICLQHWLPRVRDHLRARRQRFGVRSRLRGLPRRPQRRGGLCGGQLLHHLQHRVPLLRRREEVPEGHGPRELRQFLFTLSGHRGRYGDLRGRGLRGQVLGNPEALQGRLHRFLGRLWKLSVRDAQLQRDLCLRYQRELLRNLVYSVSYSDRRGHHDLHRRSLRVHLCFRTPSVWQCLCRG